MRTLNREHNNHTDTYVCWDYLLDLESRREVDSVKECNYLGLWKHGPDTLSDLQDWISFEMVDYLDELEWSDELTLSA